MKRIASFFMLILLCVTLSSCKKINEPRVKGDLQTIEAVESYIDEVNLALREELPKYDKWYNVDMESVIKIYDEDESIDLQMYIKVNGKIKDAEYDFESKGKFNYTIELKGEVPATEDKSETSKINLKYDMVFTVIEGKEFVEMDMTAKVDRNKLKFNIKTTWQNIDREMAIILNQLGNLVDTDIISEFINFDLLSDMLSSMEPEYFIEKLEDGLEDTDTNIYLKEKINTKNYTVKTRYEDIDEYDEEKQVSILSFELYNDNYQLKNMSEYMYMYEKDDVNIYEITIKANINSCLFGNVKTPNNEIDYL